jgi:hypothetical protein
LFLFTVRRRRGEQQTSPVNGSTTVIPELIAFTKTRGLMLLRFLARSLGSKVRSSYRGRRGGGSCEGRRQGGEREEADLADCGDGDHVVVFELPNVTFVISGEEFPGIL